MNYKSTYSYTRILPFNEVENDRKLHITWSELRATHQLKTGAAPGVLVSSAVSHVHDDNTPSPL